LAKAYRVQPAVAFWAPSPPAAGAPPGARGEPAAEPASVSAPLFAETPIIVGTSHVDNVALTLRPGTKIAGRVVFEGAAARPPAAAVQKVTVTVRALFGTVPGSTDARVDAEGRFSFAGFPPGRYVLSAATPPGPEWSIASFHIGSVDAAGQAFMLGETDVTGAVLTFTDKVATVSGTVTDASARTDIAGSTVVIFPADHEEWIQTGMSPRRTASSPVSAGGTFSTRIALPGDYFAVAIPAQIAPDIDSEFIKRLRSSVLRVSLRPGETKTISLALAGIK
jgi:hypothetical protein